MTAATAKIEITVNWRLSRFLTRSLRSFPRPRVSSAFNGSPKSDSDELEAKKRFRHARHRNASRPHTRCKTSFTWVLFDERISELPH
jgi:hypothetical protein